MEKAAGVCGIAGMRVKLGNSRAVVACAVCVAGRELAVMRTLLNGYINIYTQISRKISNRILSGERTYIETRGAFPNHALQPFDKSPRRAFILLDIARPVVLSGAEYDLFRVGSHCI